MEDDYWKLRSKISWIQEGDTNTKFFHIKAYNKHHRNKITHFKNDAGHWINDPVAILHYTFHYFQNMFTTNHVTTDWASIKQDPASFSKIDTPTLDKQLLPSEVVNAIFSFKLFKAPGPDGIHPFF